MWCHEHWNLANAPDLVTIGGHQGMSGFYSTLAFNLKGLGANLEQRVGLAPLQKFSKTWKYIQDRNLLSYVLDTSTFLKIELNRIERDTGFISNVRGYGTYLGFDCPNEEVAKAMQLWFFRSGINLLRCGPRTFGIRPSLTLAPKHGALLRDNLFYFSPNFT
jgi:4-aminobutyrate aminotransferase / (S)-3-amino-2-methylpropionate transaminase